jgi:hypothetical protein
MRTPRGMARDQEKGRRVAMSKSKQAKGEYFIRRSLGDLQFEVTKFVDGDLPVATYKVTYNDSTGIGKCDCPAATYRQTGSNDKHVRLVKKWLELGEKIQALTEESLL